jgi:hypothetical protein
MVSLRKDLKRIGQDIEAKAKTAEDHAQGKPASATWNKAKIKARNLSKDLKRDL